MLSNLQIVLFFICLIVKSFEKIFMRHFLISCIIIYCTTIILNLLDKTIDCIEFKIIKG